MFAVDVCLSDLGIVVRANTLGSSNKSVGFHIPHSYHSFTIVNGFYFYINLCYIYDVSLEENNSGIVKFTISMKMHTVSYYFSRKHKWFSPSDILLLLCISLVMFNPSMSMVDDLRCQLIGKNWQY